MKQAHAVVLTLLIAAAAHAEPWQRHTIDDSSKGADGARLADVNGDGYLDITTGWEEGGVIRVYINPGPVHAKQKWPAVTVGEVKSAEDAVFADLDNDGAMDVISSCEGSTQAMFVHWAPTDRSQYLDAAAWRTQPIPATVKATRWMFATPMQVDGRHGVDLIVGSKDPNGMIGWLEAPADARDLAAWKLHKLYAAGWIMSLIPIDMDGDGDLDVLASDRKGKNRGVLWLENPGASAATHGATWSEHRIGAADHEVMFLDVTDFDGDGRIDVIAPVKDRDILFLKRPADVFAPWSTHVIHMAGDVGRAKAARAADLNLDGRMDLIFSCESANSPKSGMMWMSYQDRVTDADWTPHDVSGPLGVKYDLIELLDLDGDGDLDAISCEERDQLGVFWYENPAR